MSAVGIYDFAGQPIRVVDGDDGEPRFVVADVARLLGYRDAANAARILKPHQAGYSGVSTPSGEQRMVVCTESGLNRLLLRSNASNAEQVQEWIESDVMPSIRRTGGYAQPRPDVAAITRSDLARMVIESEAAREAAEARAAALAPRAAVADALIDTTGDYSLREAAQVLARDHGIDTGQNRLAKYLRKIGWTDPYGQPYQRHIACGRLVRRADTYKHPKTGERVPTTQLRITAKGLTELHALMTAPTAVPLALVGA